jgi:hypothetical protein
LGTVSPRRGNAPSTPFHKSSGIAIYLVITEIEWGAANLSSIVNLLIHLQASVPQLHLLGNSKDASL